MDLAKADLQVKFVDFKSISQAELPLEAGLNVLIGPNGAGKTCLFAGLKFFKDLLSTGTARAVARAGGPKSVIRRGAKSFSMSLRIPYGNRIYRRRPRSSTAEWSLTVRLSEPDGIPFLAAESIHARTDTGHSLFRFEKVLSSSGSAPRILASMAPPEEYGRDLFSMGHGDPKQAKALMQAKFNAIKKDLKEAAEANPDRSMLPVLATLDSRFAELGYSLFGLNEYNILPSVARQSTEPQPLPSMRADGGGVAEVIHALETKAFHRLESNVDMWDQDYMYPPYRSAWRFYFPQRRFAFGSHRAKEHPLASSLENILRELSAGVQPIDGVTTQIDPTTGRRFVVFQANGQNFYPDEVSDGTIKWLCILVSIYVPKSRTYLIEKPENFLHPWMQQRLVATMREQARRTGTVFVITTHSTTILNATEVGEIFVVTPSAGGTAVQRIPDPESVVRVLETSNFGLGDLWVSGAIAGVPGYDV